MDFRARYSARLALGGCLDGVCVDACYHRFNGRRFGFVDRGNSNLHRRNRVALGVVSTIIKLPDLPLGFPLGDLVSGDRLLLKSPRFHLRLGCLKLGPVFLGLRLERGKMRLRVILGFLARTPRAGPQILETLVGIIDLGADIATKLVERFAHDDLLIPCCSPIGPIRFTGIDDWYTSSLTAPNEACQISPNLYEARNPQPAIADNRPICSFGAIRLGKSGLTRPQSPNVMGHALEHESDITKPLGLARVPGPCGGKSIIFRPVQEVS